MVEWKGLMILQIYDEGLLLCSGFAANLPSTALWLKRINCSHEGKYLVHGRIYLISHMDIIPRVNLKETFSMMDIPSPNKHSCSVYSLSICAHLSLTLLYKRLCSTVTRIWLSAVSVFSSTVLLPTFKERSNLRPTVCSNL